MLRSFKIIPFLLLFQFRAIAQTDSVKIWNLQLRKMPEDTFKIKELDRIGDQIMKSPGESRGQIDSSLYYFNQAIALSQKLRVPKLEVFSLVTAGTNLYQNKDANDGAEMFNKALSNLQHSGNILTSADLLMTYVDVLNENNGDQALMLKISKDAYEIYRRYNKIVKLNEALAAVATAHMHLEKNYEAISEFLQVSDYFQRTGNLQRLCGCERNLSILYEKKGNVQQSLHHNLEALKAVKALKNTFEIVLTESYLLVQYINLKMYKEALPYAQDAFLVYRKTKPVPDYSISLRNYVFVRVKLNQTRGLVKLIQEEEKRLPMEKIACRTVIYNTYGMAYEAAGNTREAEQYFVKTGVLIDTIQNNQPAMSLGIPNIIKTRKTIGDFFLNTEKYERARIYFNKIMHMPVGTVTPYIASEVHLALFKIDSAAGHYSSAMSHYQLYSSLFDSLYNASAAKQLADIREQHQFDTRQKDIRLLESQREARRISILKTSFQRNVLLGGIFTILIVVGIAFAGYRNKTQINHRLKVQESEINRQYSALKTGISEKEMLLTQKDWLLKEVHHRVKNNLQIIMSLLNSQSHYIGNADAMKAIEISRSRVQAISLLHKKLSNGSEIAKVDIRSYVSDLVEFLDEAFDLVAKKIHVKQFVVELALDAAQAAPIGLILNEAITNSIKYAFGPEGGEIMVSLTMQSNENMLYLKVADNGKGMKDKIDLSKISSLGLNIIAGLSTQLKGKLEINNQLGMVLSVEFPLSNTVKGLSS